jgi:hypothetical protein
LVQVNELGGIEPTRSLFTSEKESPKDSQAL